MTDVSTEPDPESESEPDTEPDGPEAKTAAEAEYELVREISELTDTPASPERDARVTEALRRAADGDHVNALMLGHLLVTHDAVLAGDVEAMAGAFARTEELWTAGRDRLEAYVLPSVLIQYLAILFTMLRRPDIPVAQVEAVADSLERRCRDLGRSCAEAHRVRMLCADRRGDAAEAARWFRAWRAEPLDDLLPEFADSGVTWLSGQGDHEGAVALHAEATARADDPAVLHMLHAAVLAPLVALGRFEEAEHRHREGLAVGPNDAAQVGEHLAYQAVVGQLDEGHDRLVHNVAVLDDLSGWAAGTFAAHAVTFLRRLRKAGRGAATLAGEQTGESEAEQTAGEVTGIEGAVTVDAVFALLVGRAEQVAREYDDVNGLDGLTLRRLHHYWAVQ